MDYELVLPLLLPFWIPVTSIAMSFVCCPGRPGWYSSAAPPPPEPLFGEGGSWGLRGPELPGGSQRVAYADVERARTVFEWGSPASAGKAEGRSPSRGARRTERTSPKEQVVR